MTLEKQSGETLALPHYGAGIIKGRASIEVDNIICEFLSVYFPALTSTVHFPINKLETLKFREVADKEEIAKSFDILRSAGLKGKNHLVFLRQCYKKIARGDLISLAEVLRDAEEDSAPYMLAHNHFCNEVSIACKTPKEAVINQILAQKKKN